MILFHAPTSCSVGIRVILEDIGCPYEARFMDLMAGDQRKPEFLALNPKGKVPALQRLDGSLLTEYPAIALWLARSFPEAKLLPEDLEGEIRALELIDFIVSSLHMRGATLALVPQKILPDDPAGQEGLRALGKQVLQKGYATLEERVKEAPYMMGAYSIVDATAFYLLRWHERAAIPLTGALADYYQRMLERPAVQRAIR